MKPIKLIAIAVAMTMLICSCSSNSGKSNQKSESPADGSHTEVSLSLPFSSTDSLNPYVAVTKVNQELSMLMYDPLIKLDNDFAPEYYLAEDISVEGKKITVTVKSAAFTDGSRLTASDVEYSISQARKTENRYKAQLKNISSYTVIDSQTIVITLKEAEPYFVNMLDFPIFKTGTAETKDSNDRVIPPIGCGRYTLEKGNSYRLVPNNSYYGEKPSVDVILLVDTPDNEALDHMIEVNAVDMAYSDLSDNSIPKMIGKQKSLPLTNMVFLGINPANRLLSDAGMRTAISAVISRANISKSAYFGYATPATGIFPPSWAESKALQHINSEQNIDEAVAYLKQLGYNNKDDDGYYIDASGNRLTISLMYNAQNSSRKYATELITAYLKKIGIEVIAKEAESFDEYTSFIANGSYDMYIGEVKLDKDMSLRQLFSGEVVYGLENTYTSEMLASYYDGTADMSTVISAFVSEMPFIPVCYRSGVFVYSQSLDKEPAVSISDIYSSI